MSPATAAGPHSRVPLGAPVMTRLVARPRARLSCETLEDRTVPVTKLGYDNFVHAVTTDSSGNVYAVGQFQQTIDVDPGPGQVWLASRGDNDGFVAKYSPAGALVWVEQFGSTAWDALGAVGTDAAGDVYVYGGYEGAATLGTTALPPTVGRSIVVAKLDPSGTVLWADQVADPGSTGGNSLSRSLAVDGGGAVYITGGLNGTADFDPGPGTAVRTFNNDMYVVKLNADGTFGWVQQLTGQDSQNGVGVAVDPTGALYAAGWFQTTLDLGRLVNQGSTAVDGFAIRLDPATGNPMWSAPDQFVDEPATGIAADEAGRVFVHAVSGQNVGTLRRLDPTSGSVMWAGQWGSNAEGGSVGGVAAAGGHVYVTGNFSGTVDFDPDPSGQYLLTGSGDAYLTRLSADGVFEGAWSAGGPSDDAGRGLAVDASGNMVVGGSVGTGTADFDPAVGSTAPMTVNWSRDGFVWKLDPAGTYQWADQVGGRFRATVDDGDAGYAETGSNWKTVIQQPTGFQGDSRTHTKGTGANKATWTFSGLAAGAYEVMAVWRPNSKYATNAPYTVNGVAVPAVNQATPAWDYDDGTGNNWKSLGTCTVAANGTITVVLTDKANGTVIADGMRIVLQPPAPLMAAGGAVTGSSAKSLTAGALRPIVAEAVRRWNATGLTAAERRLLRHVHFEIADLDGATLGLAAGRTVTLDRNAAGYGWFVDRTPRRDSEFTTPGDQGEQNHMDLLTVVMHELGHVLGQDHAPDGLMAETLTTGTRLSPVEL